jgi:hypothetical protein
MSNQTRKVRFSRRHYSPSGGRASVTITDRAIGLVALVLALALMLFCYGLWSRYDLLRMFYEDIKTELIRQGMDPHPHLPSEKP